MNPARALIVGQAGQLEAPFAGVDDPFLLVANEKGSIGCRIIIVE